MKNYHLRAFLVALSLTILLTPFVLASDSTPVFISEIGWSGTGASWADEWIELRNDGEEKIDLTGWKIVWEDYVIHLGSEENNTIQVFNSIIPPGGVILLERTDDEVVSTVNADLVYSGSLANSGAELCLINPSGDRVQIVDAEEGWPAGTSSGGEPPYCSMERSGNQWVTHEEPGNELDKNGEPIYGTPGGPIG